MKAFAFVLAFCAALLAGGNAVAQEAAESQAMLDALNPAGIAHIYVEDPLAEERIVQSERFLDLYLSDWVYGSPTLSPSGRFLAYLMRTDPDDADSVHIVVTDLDAEGGPTSVSTQIEAMRPVSLLWASEWRLLITAQEPAPNAISLLRRGLTPYTTRIYSMDRNLTGSMVLFGNTRDRVRNRNRLLHNVVDMLPDDPQNVLMPAFNGDRYHLWRANIYTGEAEMVERGSNSTIAWHTLNGEAVMRIDVNFRTFGLEVFTRNGRNGRWEHSFDLRPQDIPDTSPDFQFAGASDVPGQVRVLMRREGDEFVGLHNLDLATGEIVDTVEMLADRDIDSAWIEDATGDYIGYAYEDQRRVNVYLDEEVNRHIRALEDYFGDDISLTLVSHHGRRMLLEADSPTEYGSVYLYDLDTRSAEPVFARWPLVTEAEMFPVEAVTYTARDGLEIPAFITWPASGPGPDTPLIVMPHGGPELRDAIRHDPEAQYFANLGYAVLQPNFRGSSGYGWRFTEAGHEEWGRAMQTDLDDGVLWLREAGQIDADRVCMVGFSYGGYAALMAAATRTGLYQCAVAGGAVSDLPAFLEHINKSRIAVYDFWSARLGDPDVPEDLDRLEATSPINLVSEIDIPLYIYHGRYDRVVPITQSEDMVVALRDAEVPHVYTEGIAGHEWGRRGDDRRVQLNAVRDFLDAALNGDIDAYWDAHPSDPVDGIGKRDTAAETDTETRDDTEPEPADGATDEGDGGEE